MLLYGAEREVTGIVEAEAQRRATYSHYIRKVPRYDLNARDILAMAARRATEAARREKARKVAEAIKQAKGLQPSFVAFQNGPRSSDIVKALSEATGFTRYELTERPWRPRPIARARQLGYWLVKSLRPDLSLTSIARIFGKADHTTPAEGLRRFEEERDKAPIADWMQHEAIIALKVTK